MSIRVRYYYNMNILISFAAISLAASVGCGAFGAHALQSSLSQSDMLIWDKAVLYHMFHSLGSLVLLLWDSSSLLQSATIRATSPRISITRIASLLLCSTVIFSGSLYLLVLLQMRWLGAITPIGGSGFILGWLLLAWTFLPKKDINS